MHISQFVNEAGNPHPNPDLLVQELTAFDWVETEENPAVFYLTPEALKLPLSKTLPFGISNIGEIGFG